MYDRRIKSRIEQYLFQEKVIILYGARQVWKTTLVKEIALNSWKDYRYLNCEEYDVGQWLSVASSEKMRRFLGNAPLIILDEAQHIPDIGLKIKLLYDANPHQQIIATGSSSFELAQYVNEPLTGRAISFTLYPLSFQELLWSYETILSPSALERLLLYGSYPGIVDSDITAMRLYLKHLVEQYLFKDILTLEVIKKPSELQNLCKLLAYHIGSEVSLNQLSNQLNISIVTVERYISLLEKMFVIFRLPAWSTNQANEIGKKEKIYFWDVGVRNALIQNYDDIAFRNDKWALWENRCIAERIKKNTYDDLLLSSYFWRNYQQQEVDYVEKTSQWLAGFECKWKSTKVKIPPQFAKHYPDASFDIVTTENYEIFLG